MSSTVSQTPFCDFYGTGLEDDTFSWIDGVGYCPLVFESLLKLRTLLKVCPICELFESSLGRLLLC